MTHLGPALGGSRRPVNRVYRRYRIKGNKLNRAEGFHAKDREAITDPADHFLYPTK